MGPVDSLSEEALTWVWSPRWRREPSGCWDGVFGVIIVEPARVRRRWTRLPRTGGDGGD